MNDDLLRSVADYYIGITIMLLWTKLISATLIVRTERFFGHRVLTRENALFLSRSLLLMRCMTLMIVHSPPSS